MRKYSAWSVKGFSKREERDENAPLPVRSATAAISVAAAAVVPAASTAGIAAAAVPASAVASAAAGVAAAAAPVPASAAAAAEQDENEDQPKTGIPTPLIVHAHDCHLTSRQSMRRKNETGLDHPRFSEKTIRQKPSCGKQDSRIWRFQWQNTEERTPPAGMHRKCAALRQSSIDPHPERKDGVPLRR